MIKLWLEVVGVGLALFAVMWLGYWFGVRTILRNRRQEQLNRERLSNLDQLLFQRARAEMDGEHD